jgi:hypothetical protein
MSGRREQVTRIIRRKMQKQGAPKIIFMPAWCARDGEPLVIYALDHRAPTKEEIAVAVAAWKREQAAAKPTDEVHEKPSTMKPAHGSGEDEEIN